MKKSVKALLLVMCAIVLVVATVFTTLAYMTSKTDTITNTFTVGSIAITLDEEDVNIYGQKESDVRVTAGTQQYKLIPGNTYTKDPTVHVDEASESAWVFIKVDGSLPESITSGLKVNESVWTALDGQAGVYYLQYDADADPAVYDFEVFTEKTFTVNNIDATILAAGNNQSIAITAFAIQNDANLTTAALAWQAVGEAYAAQQG